MLIRVGLLNYVAGALLMPYAAFLDAARALRHDMEALAARFGVSFEQACHRLSTLQRPGARGVPFFFLRVDPAGNVSKRFSAAGFPFARYGGSCPRWVVHTAFAQPGVVQVQVAELPDGAAYLCFARTVTRPARAWGEPRPVHVVAMGCGVAHAGRGGLCGRARSGASESGDRPVVPAVRSAGLPQPRVSAAGAPAVAGSATGGRDAVPVREHGGHDASRWMKRSAHWHEFYMLLGTAAGTLVGLCSSPRRSAPACSAVTGAHRCASSCRRPW